MCNKNQSYTIPKDPKISSAVSPQIIPQRLPKKIRLSIGSLDVHPTISRLESTFITHRIYMTRHGYQLDTYIYILSMLVYNISFITGDIPYITTVGDPIPVASQLFAPPRPGSFRCSQRPPADGANDHDP